MCGTNTFFMNECERKEGDWGKKEWEGKEIKEENFLQNQVKIPSIYQKAVQFLSIIFLVEQLIICTRSRQSLPK